MHRIAMLCLFALFTACGGAAETEDQPETAHHAPGGESHAHGHRHHHDSPESLRPLMQGLFGSMTELRAALAAGDIQMTQHHAHAIAVACDDQDVHDVDAETFGPRFAEIDQELHAAAAEMATVAESGDLSAAAARYDVLLAACNSCHAQAPTAAEVDLSGLATTE